MPIDWIVEMSCQPRLLRTMSNPLDSGALEIKGAVCHDPEVDQRFPKCWARLVGFYAGGLGDRNPSIGFGLNQRPEPFWRITCRRGFLLCKALSHLRVAQYRQNEVVEPVDDVGRRSGRREQAVSVRRHNGRIAEFRCRRHIRQRWCPCAVPTARGMSFAV